MDSFQSINQLLNYARGEYYNKKYSSAITAYESLLKYITAVGNSVQQMERQAYADLYKQYYEEYQFVYQKIQSLQAEGKTNNDINVVYESPMNVEKKEQENPSLGKEIIGNCVLASKAIGTKAKELDEQYKIVDNTKQFFQKTVDTTKEINEKYHITDKIKETGAKAKAYDEEHHISEKVQQGLKTAGLAIGQALANATKSIANSVNDSCKNNVKPNTTQNNNKPTSSCPPQTNYQADFSTGPQQNIPMNSRPSNYGDMNSAISYPVTYASQQPPTLPSKPTFS